MSYEIAAHDYTFEAGADLSAKQYFFVKLNDAGKVVLCGAGERALGVLQNNPESGQAASVRCGGISKVVAGGVIDEDDVVASDAAGKAKAAVLATTKTDDAGAAADALVASYVIGQPLEPAAADLNVIAVLITHAGAVATTAA